MDDCAIGPALTGIGAEKDFPGAGIRQETGSQIEAQLRCVTDDERLALARVLKVTTDSLFPAERKSRKAATMKTNRPSGRS